MSLDGYDTVLLATVDAGRVTYRQGWFLDNVRVPVLDAHRLDALNDARLIQIVGGNGWQPVEVTVAGCDAVIAAKGARR